MSASEKHPASWEEEEEEDEPPQAKKSYGSYFNANAETPENENASKESCARERGDGSNEILAIGSSPNSSWREAIEQPLGGESKVGATRSNRRLRSQVRTFTAADNKEAANESEHYETPTTYSYLASSTPSTSSSVIRPPTEGLEAYGLSLLSHIAQAHVHAQRKALTLDGSLPNQQSSVAASAAQVTAMAGFPLVPAPQLIAPSYLHSSLLGQLQPASIFPTAVPQAPLQALSLPSSSLLGNLQLASISQQTGSAFVPQQQIPSPQAPSPQFQTSPLLGQLASIAQNLTGISPIHPHVPIMAGSPHQPPFLTNMTSKPELLFPSQSTSALARASFLRQLSASQNPPFASIAPQAQYPSQALLIQENNRIKDQIVALIVSQQQSSIGTNTNTPGMIPSSANQKTELLQALIANEMNLQNSTQEISAMMTTAVASAFHHSLPSPTFGNNYEMGFDSSEVASSKVAPQGQFQKRWVIRYEELKQFQQVRNHNDSRHVFPFDRWFSAIPVVLLFLTLMSHLLKI